MHEWWETFFDEAWLTPGFGLRTRGRTLSDTRFIRKVLSLKKAGQVTGQLQRMKRMILSPWAFRAIYLLGRNHSDLFERLEP